MNNERSDGKLITYEISGKLKCVQISSGKGFVITKSLWEWRKQLYIMRSSHDDEALKCLLFFLFLFAFSTLEFHRKI